MVLLIWMDCPWIPSLSQLQQLTSHCPCADWFLSCIFQSSVLGSAQWCMVRMTGRVSRAPGGPQLTTGVRSVWESSMGGLGGQRAALVAFTYISVYVLWDFRSKIEQLFFSSFFWGGKRELRQNQSGRHALYTETLILPDWRSCDNSGSASIPLIPFPQIQVFLWWLPLKCMYR